MYTPSPYQILQPPGYVIILFERMSWRQIPLDGRPHLPDNVRLWQGDSVGHWEGDTLVVDTVGIIPQSFIAISEAVGIPNNGGMHIKERIRIVDKDYLHDTLEITAPKVLTKTWTTTRIWSRQRARRLDIVEGACLQGSFEETVDEAGFAIFKPLARSPYGNIIAPD